MPVQGHAALRPPDELKAPTIAALRVAEAVHRYRLTPRTDSPELAKLAPVIERVRELVALTGGGSR